MYFRVDQRLIFYSTEVEIFFSSELLHITAPYYPLCTGPSLEYPPEVDREVFKWPAKSKSDAADLLLSRIETLCHSPSCP